MKIKTIPLLIIPIIIIITALYSIYSFISMLHNMEKTALATIIAAFIGLCGIIFSQWQSKKREISESHRENKIEVYQIFFDVVRELRDQQRMNSELSTPEEIFENYKDQFDKLNDGIVLWSSPKVIKAWLKFKSHNSGPNNPEDILIAVDNVYKAIRSDLGNSNFGLQHGDIIKMYLSDPNELKKK
ncbi:hypothetical protein [Halotalea alkalilenta]|uniref:hypothetical protein n=1 Tax=Halotalea alkalilenta TaxID=376489 RepID=UPI0012DF8F8E|nr:hypothetical protein [Halotalea alkalilenta]